MTGLERILAWSVYPEKAAQICSEKGFRALLSRALHKLTWPMVDWGGVTFFERRLDSFVDSGNLPSGVSLREVGITEVEDVKDGIDPTRPRDEIIGRFRRGDRAFAALDNNGTAAHVRWVTRSQAHVPEIGRDIVLAPHEAYFYNGYTRPEQRRRGIDGAVRGFIFRTLRADGCTKAYSYVRRDNPGGLRAASRWQRPIGTLWYVRIGRLGPLVISASQSELPTLVRARTVDPRY